ncbi:MAG TPA: hypothetical protein VFC46_09040, partial [Humisphaera sp.]|nr:hypothetical protein [Humisphaera sp.]
PLGYASPQSGNDRVSAGRVVAFVFTFIGTFLAGIVAIPNVLSEIHADHLGKKFFTPCIDAIAAICAMLFMLIAIRSSRRGFWRWGALGLLLGCGLGLLICGLCYGAF